MYEDNNNILKRFPRYDADFTLGKWEEPTESSSWVYMVVIILWIIGVAALILFTCARSPSCMCYDLLYKLRNYQYRPHTGSEYSGDWTNPEIIVGEEPHHALIRSSSQHQQGGGQKRFEDLPPAYSEVVKSDLPPYPSLSDVAQISATIPDREWTSRTRTDNRENEI